MVTPLTLHINILSAVTVWSRDVHVHTCIHVCVHIHCIHVCMFTVSGVGEIESGEQQQQMSLDHDLSCLFMILPCPWLNLSMYALYNII